ncbi:MAG: Wzy polymerase domain-containing protein [Inhella sp.]
MVGSKELRPLTAGLALACLAPTLLAYNLAPSSTLFNQLLALGAWGGVLLLAPAGWPARASLGLKLLLAALVALLMGALLAGPQGLLKAPLAPLLELNVFVLAAAAVALLGAARLGVEGLALGLLAAGLAGTAIGAVQVFAPAWADGSWIARSGYAGRAVGNLRQPNHLATLMVWAAIAAVWLAQRRGWPLPRLLGLLALLITTLVLTASRTGLWFGVPLLLLWGLLDRQLARPQRIALLLTPVLALLAWGGLHLWAELSGATFGAEVRLDSEGAGSPSRIKILLNSWELLKQQPWIGVGWGEFNRAWTLTPFPDRPIAFFDHNHNLPLQLLVELGVPLGTLVLLPLTLAFAAAVRLAWRARGGDALDRRAALMLILIAGVHSMLEYPLWYAYFLLPTAYAFGLCLAAEGQDGPARQQAPQAAQAALHKGVALVLLLGSLYAVWEYRALTAIYAPGHEGASLRERIARGQRTLFFGAQADYAAATALGTGPDALAAARRTGHQLIDARLMMAWARSLHANGQTDQALHLVARLREFRSPEGKAWLAECESSPEEWFCAAPPAPVPWTAF